MKIQKPETRRMYTAVADVILEEGAYQGEIALVKLVFFADDLADAKKEARNKLCDILSRKARTQKLTVVDAYHKGVVRRGQG